MCLITMAAHVFKELNLRRTNPKLDQPNNAWQGLDIQQVKEISVLILKEPPSLRGKPVLNTIVHTLDYYLEMCRAAMMFN